MTNFAEAPDSRAEHRALGVGSAVLLRREGGFYSLVRVGAVCSDDEYLGVIIDSRGPGGIDPRLAPGDCVRFGQRNAYRLPTHFLHPSLSNRTAASPEIAEFEDGEHVPRWLLGMLSLVERSSRDWGWAKSQEDFEFGRLRCVVCAATAIKVDQFDQPHCERCAQSLDLAYAASDLRTRSDGRKR